MLSTISCPLKEYLGLEICTFYRFPSKWPLVPEAELGWITMRVLPWTGSPEGCEFLPSQPPACKGLTRAVCNLFAIVKPPLVAYLLCSQFWGLFVILYSRPDTPLCGMNLFYQDLLWIICPHPFLLLLFVFSKHFSWATCSITSISSSMFRVSHFLLVLWEMSLHTYLKQHLSERQLLLPFLFVGVYVCYLSLLQASWEHQFAIWFVRNCLT